MRSTMTTKPSTGSRPTTGGSGSVRRAARRLVFLGTPLALAVVLWFHPHTGGDVYVNVRPVADTWLLVHVLLLVLFGLLGVVLSMLLTGYRGPVATIGRIGVATYLVLHTAYEAIAGVATGLALRATADLAPVQRAGVESVLSAFFGDPLVPALAMLGTLGSLVGVASVVVLYRRAGAPVVPLALLFGAPLGLFAHAAPSGPLFVALFFVGVAWLELGWTAAADR